MCQRTVRMATYSGHQLTRSPNRTGLEIGVLGAFAPEVRTQSTP